MWNQTEATSMTASDYLHMMGSLSVTALLNDCDEMSAVSLNRSRKVLWECGLA